MMRLLAAIFFLSISIVSGHARADTDYSCLKNCVNGGGKSSACMQQCSYGQPEAQPKAQVPDKNKSLSAPLPTNALVIKPKQQAAPEVNKDYNCMQLCLKGGMQYQMCEKRCSTPALDNPSRPVHTPTR